MNCRKQKKIVPRGTWGFDLIVNVYFFFIRILKNKKRLLKISWSKAACLVCHATIHRLKEAR